MTRSMANNSNIKQLTTHFAYNGTLEAICLRPMRNQPCITPCSAVAITDKGLIGDRTSATRSQSLSGHPRQVTLIQAEHITVIEALMRKKIPAALLRRNLVISGLNIIATKTLFKDMPMLIQIADVILEITGTCEPCSKMESILGHGAYNAMRGHGGMTAKVIASGTLHVGDQVTCYPKQLAQEAQATLF